MTTAVPTGPAGATESSRTHHDLPVHEVLLLLGTDTTTGLSTEEADRRLEQFGRNELPFAYGVPWWVRAAPGGSAGGRPPQQGLLRDLRHPRHRHRCRGGDRR